MVTGNGTAVETSVATGLRPVFSDLFRIVTNETARRAVATSVSRPTGRRSAASLPGKDQFDSRNDQHRREAKRDYADSETPAPQMRTDDAADNCCRCENESERGNGASFCEVANQAGD
jgi:hypothetical protein